MAERRELKSAFRSDMCVGVERDIGDRAGLADKPLPIAQISVHLGEDG